MSNPVADEARAMTDADLAEAINEAYRELFNLNFQRGTRQLQDPNAPRTARRQIARLRTILRERQLAAEAGEPIAPLPPPEPVANEQAEEAGGGDSAAAEDRQDGE